MLIGFFKNNITEELNDEYIITFNRLWHNIRIINWLKNELNPTFLIKDTTIISHNSFV